MSKDSLPRDEFVDPTIDLKKWMENVGFPDQTSQTIALRTQRFVTTWNVSAEAVGAAQIVSVFCDANCSVARGEAMPGSDIDMLTIVISQAGGATEQEVIEEYRRIVLGDRIADLERWTGSEPRVFVEEGIDGSGWLGSELRERAERGYHLAGRLVLAHNPTPQSCWADSHPSRQQKLATRRMLFKNWLDFNDDEKVLLAGLHREYLLTRMRYFNFGELPEFIQRRIHQMIDSGKVDRISLSSIGLYKSEISLLASGNRDVLISPSWLERRNYG